MLKEYKVFFHIVFGAVLLTHFVSCNQLNNENVIVESKPSFSYFSFLKQNNPQLDKDYICTIDDSDTIRCFIPGAHTDSLIATFAGNYSSVEVEGVEQHSGASAQDYNKLVTFSLIENGGSERNIIVFITGYNGIPRFEITTKDAITSKTEYVGADIKISNSPIDGTFNIMGKIKGRGNWTWATYPKKPYKIKLNAKLSLLGFPANKDWVLLAEYCDRSLLRTAYMSEVSKALKMPFTIHYKHVELFLNGEYLGVYLLTDQVEKGKDRVDIGDDGFIIENDRYWEEEPLHFKTDLMGVYYTFKYPKPSSAKIVENDTNFEFIKSFFNGLEDRLLKGEELHTIIDYDTFAKWYICNELLGNMDTNIYYVLPCKGGKLQMFPVWDAEWSLGLSVLTIDEKTWLNDSSFIDPEMHIWDLKLYFPFIMKDDGFIECLKHNWMLYRSACYDVNALMSQMANGIDYAQKSNFARWPIMGKKVSVELFVANTYEEELAYIQEYYNKRFAWLDSLILSNK